MTMDFQGLLYAAHKNEITKEKSKARFYPSSFGPPKKEEKSKGLSVNVKKFLARKEEEEKQRKIEEERKRETLLQLRNNDNKARKRVQVMLKRTKSYNKSVLSDAIDEVNTADTMNGPQQCDEDDYGYVSQEASSLYNKMMEKYGSVPTDNNMYAKKGKTLSTDLHSTKDRVKMALQRQEEEEMGPHKRKRKKKDDDAKQDNEVEEESKHVSDKNHHKERGKEKEKEEKEKVKPKRAVAPPPIDFTELLKLAEKKQYEPPPLVLKLKEVKRQQQKEPERLMTKKEKLEYERTRDKRLQRESGAPNDSRKDSSQKVETKTDRKEKEKEDERKKLKEQRLREEERNRRQRDTEREQERRRQEDREQERRRQEEREQERRRQEDREHERRRQEDREQERRRQEDREQERRRQDDRERERRLEEDRERQRERERIRELEKELARHKERERLRELEIERREKERKLSSTSKKTDSKSVVPRPSLSSSSNKPTDIRGNSSKSVKPPGDKATASKDYRNGDVKKKLVSSEKIQCLFGDRDSVSPERPPSKTDKPKPRPVERIKISNTSSASLDDLFGDDVTIRSKQKLVQNSSSNKVPSKPSDKLPSSVKPSPSAQKVNRDKPDLDRKRPSDGNGRDYPEKRPKLGENGKPVLRKEFPPKDLKSRQFPPSDVRSRQFPPSDVRSRQFPPADVKSRQFPPPDVKSRQFPPSDVARKGLAPNRRFEYERADSGDSSDEDEDEYDSEMDDFIDDGPENGEDYSKYIKDIFGYDKSRYANESDGECAESNYTQVMREEVKSAKIGLMEDIEDMRKEEMEKKLKAMRKAAMRGKR